MHNGRMTTVTAVLADLGQGRTTVPAAADQLSATLVPRRHRSTPTGDAMALLHHEFEHADDLPTYTPDSWDDVHRAIRDGVISEDQAAALRALVDIPAAVGA